MLALISNSLLSSTNKCIYCVWDMSESVTCGACWNLLRVRHVGICFEWGMLESVTCGTCWNLLCVEHVTCRT